MVSGSTGQHASGENVISLGSQAWNIADGFTKIKILRLLIQIDIDEEIAMFGKKDENEVVPQEEIPYRRIEYFDKFIFHLRQVMGNCKFAIEKGNDEEVFSKLMQRVENVENVREGIYDEKYNSLTKETTIIINERHFRKCFNVLREIKDELNFPINRGGLIFRQGETLDIDEIMRSIEQGE
jgi:hypothetical protein